MAGPAALTRLIRVRIPTPPPPPRGETNAPLKPFNKYLQKYQYRHIKIPEYRPGNRWGAERWKGPPEKDRLA